MDDLRQSLQSLYLAAVYEVDVPGGRIAFRIGEAIPRLAGQAFALITAYNPGACRPSPAENERRNAALERRLAEAGHKVLPGRGRDVSGDHVEPSFAAFGVTLGAALAVAVAYRTNPFYVSMRVGYGSRPFPMLKIKTMRDDADSEVPEHLNETGGPTFKATNDPRITGIGRVLRVTSIDEMPQFLNVVWGQMSLVGPRPALPGEVVHYSGPQLERLSVKPGITCIWQVSGRSDIPFRTWMAMDRVYVRRRSLGLDLWLLLRTPWVVLAMRGAR